MEKENSKYISIEVTQYMCHKVKGVIKPGDFIIVSHDKEDKPLKGEHVFISSNEYQWIDKYSYELKKSYRNIYKILKVIMMS